MWEAVQEMMRVPYLRTELVLALARDATTKDRQAYLGAGPLEELIAIAEDDELSSIVASLGNPRLANAFWGVNYPEDPVRGEWLHNVRATLTRLGHQEPVRALDNPETHPDCNEGS